MKHGETLDPILFVTMIAPTCSKGTSSMRPSSVSLIASFSCAFAKIAILIQERCYKALLRRGERSTAGKSPRNRSRNVFGSQKNQTHGMAPMVSPLQRTLSGGQLFNTSALLIGVHQPTSHFLMAIFLNHILVNSLRSATIGWRASSVI